MVISTEDILKSIIEDYKEIESSFCSSDSLLKKCEKIRESISTITIQHLVNVEGIIEEIDKAKNHSSQTLTVLNFFDYLIDGFPHPVFAPSFEQCRSMQLLNSDDLMKNYKNFLSLLASRLLQILVFEKLSTLHNITNKILDLWMEVMKMQNVKIYQMFLNDLVSLLKELKQLEKDNFPYNCDELNVTNICLKTFGNIKFQQNDVVPLMISSFEVLERWQIVCTNLLQLRGDDVAILLFQSFDELLSLSVNQILNSRIPLKTVSLKLCSSLILTEQSLSEHVFEYFVTSVVSLVEYATVAINNQKYKELGISEESLVEYHETLSKFLHSIFKVETSDNSVSTHLHFKTFLHLDYCYLNLLTSTLSSLLGNDIVVCQTTLLLCNFISVSAVNHAKDSSITKKFIKYIFNITSFLMKNCCLIKDDQLLKMALTNFFVFFGYLEKDNNPQQPFMPTLSHKKSLPKFSLSLKRKCDSDLLDQSKKDEKHNRNHLQDLLLSYFQKTLSDQKRIFTTAKQEKTIFVLQKLKENIKKTSLIFEPFLNAFVFLQDIDVCKSYLIFLFQKLKINSIFCNCVEFFINFISQIKETFDKEKLDSAHETFKDILILAKLFLTWHRVLNQEQDQVMDQEYKISLSVALIFFSTAWLEDLPWKDLKTILIPSLSQSCLVLFCKHLKLSNSFILDKSDCNKNSKLAIVKDLLLGLALVDGNCALNWRISVLIEWGLASHCDDVVMTCLQSIPTFCSGIKSVSITPIVVDLISYIKHGADFEKNEKAANIIAEIFQPLTLILSKNFIVKMQANFNNNAVNLTFEILKESNNRCYLVDDEKLTLVNEFEKKLFSYVKTCETHKSCSSWSSVLLKLSNGVSCALQCIDKQQQIFLRLLSQWLKYFDFDFNMKQIKPVFIFLNDDLEFYIGFFLREAESILQDAIKSDRVSSLCNLTQLFGFLINFCASHNYIDHDLFQKPIQCLCKVLCSSFSRASSLAYSELDKFALKYQSVMNDYRKSICTAFIFALLDGNKKCRSLHRVLEDAAHLYTTTLNNFLSSNIHYLLPPIVLREMDDDGGQLLQIFSTALETNKNELIKQNFKHIFCFAVTSGADLELLFQFLEKETKLRRESLVLMTYGSLIQHLMAHVSVNKESVCRALRFVHEIKSSKTENLPESELLQPHFLSVLTFFNSQLRLASVAKAEKLQVFESLINLLYMLDPAYVSAVFVKIVNTLCLAQQEFIDSKHAAVCCKSWRALAFCVKDSCLGGFLSQIVVMLLPCLKKHPTEVAGVLKFLVEEKQQFTKGNFSELYFLPDHELLKSVKSRINKELHAKNTTQSDFLYTLEQVNRHLSHDSAQVRIFALTQARSVLQSNQRAMQRHCLISGGVSDLVRSLVPTLLRCCRDPNTNIKLLAAQCLGEIGAVDPDRLSLVVPKSRSKDLVCMSFDDEDFAFNLLNCLVQAFLVAKPCHQDISAFAIQELLKIYKCKESSKDSQGRQLWRKFPEQIQAVLEPHLSSRYVLKKSEINLDTLKRPILHRKQNMTFRDWIGTFCAVLMQMASASSRNSPVVRGVSDACAAVARGDVNVALFLLPSTVVEVLKCGDDQLMFLQEEMMAVLESTELLNDVKALQKPTDGIFPSDDNDGSDSVLKQVSPAPPTHSSHLSQLSAQAVFSVYDHVTLWLHQSSAACTGGAPSRSKLKEKEQANKFLSLIPQKKLALASLQCKDYTRALLHYETHLRESSKVPLSAESAAFLQRIFIEMEEPDGVLGVVNVRGVEPTLETQLLVFESTGALQDAASCYERIICNDPNNMFHYKGFFKCLIDLGQLSEAVNLIDGTVANNPTWKNDVTSYCVEACWRLGNWDLLEKKVKSSDDSKSWSIAIGKAILSIRDKNWNKLDELLNDLYQSQTDPLSVASMESNSFQRGYEHILRLHTLSDLERFAKIVRDQSEVTAIDDAMSLWQLRLQVVQPSFRACDPLLSLGRVLLPLIYKTNDGNPDCDRYVGKMWLQSSKLARKCGLLQTAYGALLSAQAYSLPGHCIEHAKLLWKKGESHQALLALQRGFAEHFANDSASLSSEERRERAKVMLFEAKLMEESSSYDSNVVLRKYKEVVTYVNDWEDSHFYCGRYYDKLMTTMMGENKASAKAHHLYYIMSHYGRSLCFGTSHIYESLTKLLTLWLDYGETAAKLEKAGRPQSVEDVQRLVEVIVDVRSRLPAYVFYVAFSQLTSRICHQHEPTYNQLKEILISVILAFPQRALWSMMAISKSSFQQRATRCQEIFDRVQYKESKLAKLLTDSITLTNRLLDLCNKPVSTTQSLSISTHFKQLKKLVENSQFSQIMLPLQKFMNVVLPQSKRNSVFDSQGSHDPFPEPTAHIVGFDDTVEVLSSLQRPKKISVRASDGRSYAFLCKPKDDLRKDARLTEFAAIVNKCLDRDAESGKRRLRIRTYAVIPLNEECGLIEWVDNLKGLRHILLPIYKAKALYCSAKQLKAWQLPMTAPVHKKLEVFRTKYLARHPPVFYEWFLSTFADPSSWYSARLSYARSIAVMSMVGYILGLGDRHGENILFDSNSGEAMHVDFNCLFNKGLSLEVPEIVPFRLTHNMVDAMGPTKYEGFFRKACEVTMNVLREQREPLMSVLKTFIYDPLVEWSKKSRSSSSYSSGEVLTEKALTHVNDIDKRLRGVVGKSKGLPLSIEGHVHYLIQEATDQEKLCQMYIGWAPFM